MSTGYRTADKEVAEQVQSALLYSLVVARHIHRQRRVNAETSQTNWSNYLSDVTDRDEGVRVYEHPITIMSYGERLDSKIPPSAYRIELIYSSGDQAIGMRVRSLEEDAKPLLHDFDRRQNKLSLKEKDPLFKTEYRWIDLLLDRLEQENA